jgi:nucleolar protein 58
MRCREWYGWHFPELGKIVTDPQVYAKTLKAIGMKQHAQSADLTEILPEELIDQVKAEAEISMGTDISDLDLENITQLCDQIIELSAYRTQLFEYLKNRMNALAPNLTVLLGELVGARLISKAGSLVQLAKYPASTVQILGAEKALFRALKTKKDTPKYGLIYHAQLVSQSNAKIKGKIARKLAAKVSLSTRVDALCDENLGNEEGIKSRAYIEQVIKVEQERGPKRFTGVKQAPATSYKFKKEIHEYDQKADMTLKKGLKRPFEEENVESMKKVKLEGEPAATVAEGSKKEKKAKKAKKPKAEEVEEAEAVEEEEE